MLLVVLSRRIRTLGPRHTINIACADASAAPKALVVGKRGADIVLIYAGGGALSLIEIIDWICLLEEPRLCQGSSKAKTY